MSFGSVLQEVDAHNRLLVQAATFGHLAPEPQRTYPGYIVFAYSEYGDVTPVKVDFDGLPDSPWFYGDMMDFLDTQVLDIPSGKVLRFDGRYTKFKNGGCRFSGKVREINLA
jgi:hypothetical protein